MKCLSLNKKGKKATGHKSTFLAFYFWFFGTFLAILNLEQKMPIFENHILKIGFITLKAQLGTLNYIFMLHMTQILIFASNFDFKHVC